jgi:hypothetical protein
MLQAKAFYKTHQHTLQLGCGAEWLKKCVVAISLAVAMNEAYCPAP